MRILNRRYRGVDSTTDVLSFPQISNFEFRNSELKKQKPQTHSEFRIPHFELPLGDIVINLHQTKRQAAEHGHTFNEELRLLMIHGLLHLLGYDHEKGGYAARKMKEKTEELFDDLL
jgi:probable rRNA maturation factor